MQLPLDIAASLLPQKSGKTPDVSSALARGEDRGAFSAPGKQFSSVLNQALHQKNTPEKAAKRETPSKSGNHPEADTPEKAVNDSLELETSDATSETMAEAGHEPEARKNALSRSLRDFPLNLLSTLQSLLHPSPQAFSIVTPPSQAPASEMAAVANPVELPFTPESLNTPAMADTMNQTTPQTEMSQSGNSSLTKTLAEAGLPLTLASKTQQTEKQLQASLQSSLQADAGDEIESANKEAPFSSDSPSSESVLPNGERILDNLFLNTPDSALGSLVSGEMLAQAQIQTSNATPQAAIDPGKFQALAIEPQAIQAGSVSFGITPQSPDSQQNSTGALPTSGDSPVKPVQIPDIQQTVNSALAASEVSIPDPLTSSITPAPATEKSVKGDPDTLSPQFIQPLAFSEAPASTAGQDVGILPALDTAQLSAGKAESLAGLSGIQDKLQQLNGSLNSNDATRQAPASSSSNPAGSSPIASFTQDTIQKAASGSAAFQSELSKAGDESSPAADSSLSEAFMSPDAPDVSMLSASMPQPAASQGSTSASTSGGPAQFISQAHHPMEQVLDGTAYSVKNGHKELIIRLNPDNLGEVRVNLVSLGNKELSARLIASTKESHELLKSQMDTLKNSLEAQGIRVEHLAVVLAGAADTRNGMGQGTGGNTQQHFQHSSENPNAQSDNMRQQDFNRQDQSGGNIFAQMNQAGGGAFQQKSGFAQNPTGGQYRNVTDETLSNDAIRAEARFQHNDNGSISILA